jgi:hypothetical protein
MKEQYYHVWSYDDLYTKWITLQQKRNQAGPELTNVFHTLHTKLGIKYSKRHLVLKYQGGKHKYIQDAIDFEDLPSLHMAYQYSFKIEQKLKKTTWKFCPGNPSHQK